MEKIKMTTPLVEMDGDEMTRIIWNMMAIYQRRVITSICRSEDRVLRSGTGVQK